MRRTLLWGLGAIACYAIHATFHLLNGRPEDLLWACHLGAALVGVGLLIRSDTTNGIGLLFLLMGTPLWLMDLVSGGVFYPTSAFTHIGGLLIGLCAVRRKSFPAGTWWRAVIALIGIILISRLVTPREANVNMAFAVYPGWEKIYPSHSVYLMVMIVFAAIYFLLCEFGLRRWFVRRTAEEVA